MFGCGLPVCALWFPAITELVINGENGIIVAPSKNALDRGGWLQSASGAYYTFAFSGIMQQSSLRIADLPSMSDGIIALLNSSASGHMTHLESLKVSLSNMKKQIAEIGVCPLGMGWDENWNSVIGSVIQYELRRKRKDDFDVLLLLKISISIIMAIFILAFVCIQLVVNGKGTIFKR
jgi:hypothetical protein